MTKEEIKRIGLVVWQLTNRESHWGGQSSILQLVLHCRLFKSVSSFVIKWVIIWNNQLINVKYLVAFLQRNKSKVVLHGLLSSYLPSTSTPKSHGMLQTGGVRSVLSDTEINPRLIYFVGVPRKTKNSRFGLLFRSLHVLLHVQKVNTVYSRAVIPVFKAGSGDNLATTGKCIWKT